MELEYKCFCGESLLYSPNDNKWFCPYSHTVYLCKKCESKGKKTPLQWIKQYQRWYCYECKEYQPTFAPTDIYLKLKEHEMEAGKIIELGIQAHEKGDFDEAERLYLQALEINERLRLDEGIATVLIWMGNLAKDREQFDKAEGYYLRALKIYQQLGDKKIVPMLYQILGMIVEERSLFDNEQT
ncbi:MAG: tetratricopeptide repeat protein [Candidatus Bathyarchaeia archaeon]